MFFRDTLPDTTYLYLMLIFWKQKKVWFWDPLQNPVGAKMAPKIDQVPPKGLISKWGIPPCAHPCFHGRTSKTFLQRTCRELARNLHEMQRICKKLARMFPKQSLEIATTILYSSERQQPQRRPSFIIRGRQCARRLEYSDSLIVAFVFFYKTD